MAGVVIRLDDVSKYYKLYDAPKDRLKEALSPVGRKYHKKFYAIKNVSMDVREGEILGIVGKNGSGKSTLLKLVSGILRPDAGSIEVKGKITALLELGAGLNPEFSGIDNIYFYGTILGISRPEMDKRIDRILEFADIGEFIHQPLKIYSSGMRSRLAFSVAVHVDPDILILDEILSVGDVLFRRKCHARMQEFFESGKTVIYVSHDANSITSICTRALFLYQGGLLLDSDAKTTSMIYQKYLFSSDENRDRIIEEIENTVNDKDPERLAGDEVIAPSEESFLMEDFAPKSTVKYRNFEVDINNYMLLDAGGKQVNALCIGSKYYFRFEVDFHDCFRCVKFGCYIKNEQGTIISGLTMPSRSEPVDNVVSGEKYTLTAEFGCDLSPGIYFMDVGVTSDVDNEKIYLNMIQDALVFRVLRSESNYWGMVNLWVGIDVQKA
jgi:lipopolysaccharide transport system ATP-binding protein